MARDEIETEPAAAAQPARRFALRYWVALIVVALSALFIAQNRDRPRIHILWITVESPMWLILTIIFVAGLLVGLLLRRRRRS
ncbi:MAG: DUF1049 domain-containing protein [Mycobacterium sp.]|nr:DUF1049 domain-containing protein [Mycobacterium sp.]